MQNQIDDSTDLIIVGGGIFGASIAYYFKRDNPDKEVVVYERNELCSGNTGLSAALMSTVRQYAHVIPMSLETYKVIPELEKITGTSIPIQYNGAIHIAVRPKTVAILKDMKFTASQFGIRCEEITPKIAHQMAPWLNASMAKKIIHFPGEAITDPYLLCMAFANAAKALGAKFVRNTEVTDLWKKGNEIIGIHTATKIHYAKKTVLAAGVWSSILAEKAGIHLPMAPVRSQYWITEASETLFPPTSPTVLISEANFYARPQSKSLLFGIREANSIYVDPRKLPKTILDYSFNNDMGWDDLEENYKKLLPFFPAFEDTGIKNYVAGFSGYTPDNQFILGEVPGISGILLATGCVGAGISVSGGVGLGISRLASDKENPFDFSKYQPNRFGHFNPFGVEHLAKCAAARSAKVCG